MVNQYISAKTVRSYTRRYSAAHPFSKPQWGVGEELTKIIFQISPSIHLIYSSGTFTVFLRGDLLASMKVSSLIFGGRYSQKELSVQILKIPKFLEMPCTVMIPSFRTDMSGQPVQTQIRLLLEEQSDQGLHCLLFHLHLFDKIP